MTNHKSDNTNHTPDNLGDLFLLNTNTTTTITITSITTTTIISNPSLDTIPTTKDFKEMEDSLTFLRHQLASAKQQ